MVVSILLKDGELTIRAGNPTITNHLNHHRSNTHPTACLSGLIHTSLTALITFPSPLRSNSASVVQSSCSGSVVLLLVLHKPPYPKLPPVKLLKRSPTDCFRRRLLFLSGTARKRPSSGVLSWPSLAPVSVPSLKSKKEGITLGAT